MTSEPGLAYERMGPFNRLDWLDQPGFRVMSRIRRFWVGEPNPVYGPLMQSLGTSLRAYREAAGYSQESFADRIGMHRTYYSAIERGEKNLQIDTLKRICDGLAVRMCDVLKDVGG